MPYISLKTSGRSGTLLIETIPKNTWRVNVRSKFSKEDWDLLRKWVYRRSGYRCEICGGAGKKWPVECHEQWKWDTRRKTQKLVGLVALCPDCHAVKHIGHSLATKNRKEMQRLYKHQRRINRWSKRQQQDHFGAVRRRAERRNKVFWKVDMDYANKLLFKIRENMI